MKKERKKLEENFRNILKSIGEDVDREGLKETPKRYIKFLNEFIKPKELDFNFTTFDSEEYNEMIIVKDINFYSLCEHHTLPFFGKAVVGYIPNKRIVGLSKIPRLVDFFANRLQNQERITKQVAHFLMEKLEAEAVGVILTANHTCMSMRGIKKDNSLTITSCMLGEYFEEYNARNEFLKLGGK